MPREINKQEKAHILVIDDEASVARFIGMLLNNKGYRTTVFNDSRQALAGFREEPDAFDLVITDQSMPELTGIELAKAMLERRCDLPIILCTGERKEADMLEAYALGIRAYLTKPISTKELHERVIEVLGGEHSKS